MVVGYDHDDEGEYVTNEQDLNEQELEEYNIVGSQEADPINNRISNESPIAKAIMGYKAGDVVTVDSPNGKYNIEIIEIV